VEQRQASIGTANSPLSPAERSVLDPIRQIRLFAKLKLADCASARRAQSLYCAARRRRLRLNLKVRGGARPIGAYKCAQIRQPRGHCIDPLLSDCIFNGQRLDCTPMVRHGNRRQRRNANSARPWTLEIWRKAIGDWCGRPDSNRHSDFSPRDFHTSYGFRRPASARSRIGVFVVWTIPSPWRVRALGAARLVSTPSRRSIDRCAWLGIAR
jgi:hypothetical protein